MTMACSMSPALRNSLASGAKYRRGFSSNFFFNSSIRAVLAIKASAAARRGFRRADQDILHEGQVNQKCVYHLILARVAGYFFTLTPTVFLQLEGVLPRAPNHAELRQVRVLDSGGRIHWRFFSFPHLRADLQHTRPSDHHGREAARRRHPAPLIAAASGGHPVTRSAPS